MATETGLSDHHLEAVIRRCSVKKVFLEILQNSQENNCARVSFFFIKKETLAQVFSCEFCEISKNTFYYRTPLVAASDHHLMLSVMKTKLSFEEPKRLVYRSFWNFNNNYFEKELLSKLNLSNKDYTTFEDNFVNALNPFVPHASFLYPLKISENLTVF